MEDAAIREGFRDLKPGSACDNLYEAALCRERADWIVGMNATRLFSCLCGTTVAVGRVMTPTLGIAVMRKAERKGLSTPATRAATIEKLVQKGFIECRCDKKTKYLVPTDRAIP